jgi:hypothetical protein
MPYARCALFGASSTRANKVLKARHFLCGWNLALLFFACLFAKNKCAKFGIAKTGYSTRKREGGK